MGKLWHLEVSGSCISPQPHWRVICYNRSKTQTEFGHICQHILARRQKHKTAICLVYKLNEDSTCCPFGTVAHINRKDYSSTNTTNILVTRSAKLVVEWTERIFCEHSIEWRSRLRMSLQRFYLLGFNSSTPFVPGWKCLKMKRYFQIR